MKRFLLLAGIFLVTSSLQAQNQYWHNVFSGRIALADTFNRKLKWEIHLQQRRQNTKASNLNMWEEPQFTGFWTWLTYSPNKNLDISATPLCFFRIHNLIIQPSDIQKPTIKEFRWALMVEHKNRLGKIVYANKYTVESRWRDFNEENIYLHNWRIRYQARLEYPLSRIKKPFKLVVSDEVFIQFGKAVKGNPNIFDQNRLYGGIAYGFSNNIKFSLGYLYMLQERISGQDFDNVNMVFGILTFDNLFSQFKKKKLTTHS
jgi:hypothetical protein